MKKVLVVDDMEGWRKFNTQAVRMLLDNDAIIDTASSGQEGYSKVLENTKEPYDIILTDMQMESDYEPKMAGEWLIEQIQALPSYYKTRIIIISASFGVRKIAESYGVFCIPKSVASVSKEAYKEVLITPYDNH